VAGLGDGHEVAQRSYLHTFFILKVPCYFI